MKLLHLDFDPVLRSPIESTENIRHSGRNVPMPPLIFLGQLALTMLPLTLPIWMAGLWYYLLSNAGKPFRAIGWACLVTMGLIMVLNPRVYYVYPSLPILFASGSVAWGIWLAHPRLQWVKPSYAALMILVGAIFAPFAVPVLPIETYISYSAWMHFQPPRIETHQLGPLPQLYADQFGWEEMVATVARVYNNLAPEVRSKTAIFAQNYGQAGAVDLFGAMYGLPKAISGHQNYFFWGPRDYTGESVIVMQGQQEELEKLFSSVEKVGRVDHAYSMPYCVLLSESEVAVERCLANGQELELIGGVASQGQKAEITVEPVGFEALTIAFST